MANMQPGLKAIRDVLSVKGYWIEAQISTPTKKNGVGYGLVTVV